MLEFAGSLAWWRGCGRCFHGTKVELVGIGVFDLSGSMGERFFFGGLWCWRLTSMFGDEFDDMVGSIRSYAVE
jgi:hypothetical protein